MNCGDRVVVLHAANLPCKAGDVGTVTEIRDKARQYPVHVRLDGLGSVECFALNGLRPMNAAEAWMDGVCDDEEAA